MTDKQTRTRLRLNGWSDRQIDTYIEQHGSMSPGKDIELVLAGVKQRSTPGWALQFPPNFPDAQD